MPSRHRSRQRAVQILYLWDMRKQDIEDAMSAFYHSLYSEENDEQPERDHFMEHLVKGTVRNAEDIDQRIGQYSENWRVERMPTVDRNILRLAIFEMLHEQTPPVVVIDQAIELARRFSGDESVAFINGVLDAIHKTLPPRPEGEAQAPPE